MTRIFTCSICWIYDDLKCGKIYSNLVASNFLSIFDIFLNFLDLLRHIFDLIFVTYSDRKARSLVCTQTATLRTAHAYQALFTPKINIMNIN